MMNSQEMETAVRLKLNPVVLIIEDSAYGMIRWKQQADGFADWGLTFGNPDFVAYAASFGAGGSRHRGRRARGGAGGGIQRRRRVAGRRASRLLRKHAGFRRGAEQACRGLESRDLGIRPRPAVPCTLRAMHNPGDRSRQRPS
jgi:hypothetical protein